MPTHTHTHRLYSLSPRSYLPSPVSCFPFPYSPFRLPSPVPFSSPRAYGGPSVVSNFVRDNLDPAPPSSLPYAHQHTLARAARGNAEPAKSAVRSAGSHQHDPRSMVYVRGMSFDDIPLSLPSCALVNMIMLPGDKPGRAGCLAIIKQIRARARERHRSLRASICSHWT